MFPLACKTEQVCVMTSKSAAVAAVQNAMHRNMPHYKPSLGYGYMLAQIREGSVEYCS